MKTFLNLKLLIVLLCTNFCFPTETLNFDEELITHQVNFNSDSENISQEEFDKIDAFINEIANVDIKRISIISGEANNEILSTKRAELIKQIIADYNFNEYLISTLNTNEEFNLTPIEEALLNTLSELNEKVVIAVAPRKLVAGSFFADDVFPGETFNIENVKFEAGLRYVNDDSMEILEDLADFLVSREDIYLTVQGHVCCVDYGVDARDTETGDRNLSVVRAKFVHDFLVNRGVDTDRVSYEGLAGTKSLGRSDEEDRRVEILIRRAGGTLLSAY